jgi:benzoyl-CoA 2,3-dioxygenase component A
MGEPVKQHLIDPEICIRCHTCENTCPIEAITHDDNNVVVDASKCNFCMDCIPVCPTGSIDEWRVVNTPYSLDEQFEWMELPEQEELAASGSADAAGDADSAQTGAHGVATDGVIEALDDAIAALLNEAHSGAGGRAKAPDTASKPSINLYNKGRPAEATVQGNYRLTSETADSDVRHIILDLGALPFPVLEGQSVGITPPGVDENGKPHLPRLYSISSPRDGERPNYNNISLTVKREDKGLCSNYVCDLKQGDKVQLTGPFGATFLMPNDNDARLLMVCTGTGSAPFRAFTMHRERSVPAGAGKMMLVFGARSPESLPYFGPLKKVPDSLLARHLVFSRLPDQPRRYVQDELLEQKEQVLEFLQHSNSYIYICGLRAMEDGVERAFAEISSTAGLNWDEVKQRMRDSGRYHVETY